MYRIEQGWQGGGDRGASSVGSLRERKTIVHASTSNPMNPVIIQPVQGRAGQVQHNSEDYIIIFKVSTT